MARKYSDIEIVFIGILGGWIILILITLIIYYLK